MFLIKNIIPIGLKYCKTYTKSHSLIVTCASFALFLAENRGHYMVENILEDGLNDFFFYHLIKYPEIWKLPVNFVGSIAFGFRDVLEQLCNNYEFDLGKIIKRPMEGLVNFHGR